MAIPTDTMRQMVFYHGTASAAAAKSIMEHGLKGQETQGRGHLAPVKGRVYLTPSIEYATIYAIGGAMMGHEMPEERWFGDQAHERNRGRYGYVFAVRGSDLGDVQPDEDSVGEFLSRHSERVPERPYDFRCTIPNGDRGRQVWDYIRSSMTGRQADQALQGYVAQQASGGKRALKNMPDWMKLYLLDQGAHLANDGVLHPFRCWRIDKTRTKEIARDVSNFFEIAEEIPLNVLAEKAPPGKKARRFIRKAKADFKARYGDHWKQVLYATAHKMFGEVADPTTRNERLDSRDC